MLRRSLGNGNYSRDRLWSGVRSFPKTAPAGALSAKSRSAIRNIRSASTPAVPFAQIAVIHWRRGERTKSTEVV
jgi:hypothetical protein